jgi:subtilisin family serine protease
MIATGVRVMNNSWGISPPGWIGGSSGGAVGTLTDVTGQYNTDTSKAVFDAAENAAHAHQVLLVFAVGNGGPEAVPDALTSFPYYRPDMMGYLMSVVNIARPTDGFDVGAKFVGLTDYVMSRSATPCGQTRAWCVGAPGTNINSTYFTNLTSTLVSYQAAAAKPAATRTAQEAALVTKYASYAQYIDTAPNIWYVPTYQLDTGGRDPRRSGCRHRRRCQRRRRL